EQKIAFYERVLERIRAMPGVISASGIIPLPLSGDGAGGGFQIVGRRAERGEEPTAQMRWVNQGYFETMKIPIVAGRDFTAADDLKSTPVAIVNQTFVKKYFPNEEPLGKKMELPIGVRGDATTFQIAGVVKDVKHRTE